MTYMSIFLMPRRPLVAKVAGWFNVAQAVLLLANRGHYSIDLLWGFLIGVHMGRSEDMVAWIEDLLWNLTTTKKEHQD